MILPETDDGTRFWRIVKDQHHREVFGQAEPSTVAAVFYFTAAEALFKLGCGTDYRDHPRNPFCPRPKPPAVVVEAQKLAETFEFEAFGTCSYGLLGVLDTPPSTTP